MVSPPPDVGSQAGNAAVQPSRTAPSAPAPSGSERGTTLPEGPPAIDRADIRPLDISGALQILVAEVRAALIETLGAAPHPADVGSASSQPLGSPNSADVAATATGSAQA